MKTAFLLIAAACLPTLAAAAPPSDKEIMSMAPNVRVEQRCNAKAMGVIGREHHDLHPDELVAYAFADTVLKGDTIRAPGAAVRSGGKWFRLSYTCETKDEGVDVVTFQYKLGEVVPRDEWDAHYLVP